MPVAWNPCKNYQHELSCQWLYHVECTSSRPITEVKQHWARIVLRWETALVILVLQDLKKFTCLPVPVAWNPCKNYQNFGVIWCQSRFFNPPPSPTAPPPFPHLSRYPCALANYFSQTLNFDLKLCMAPYRSPSQPWSGSKRRNKSAD